LGNEPKSAQLWRLNAQTGTIDSATVRPDLSRALDRLQQRSANLAVALRAWQSGDRDHDTNEVSGTTLLRSSAITSWQFDESVPLIVHPEVRNSDDAPVDWIFAAADQWAENKRTTLLFVIHLSFALHDSQPGLNHQ
jgi:hypothetical protein